MANDKPFHHGNLRQALIATAMDIIREQGAEAVTMRGLSQAIGVSRTAAYRHFENKRELLYAVMEEGFRAILQFNRDLASRTDADILDTLEAFGRAYLEFALENPELYRLMFGAETAGDDRPPQVEAVIDQAFGLLMDVFRRGQEQGDVMPGCVFTMASVMWANMHGLASLLMDGQLHAYARDHAGGHLPPDARTRPEDVIERVADLALHMLRRSLAASFSGRGGNSAATPGV